MASINWTTGASGDWNTGTLWSSGTVPATADDVTIDALAPVGADYTVTIATGESEIVTSVTLNAVNNLAGANVTPYNAAVLEIDGTLTFAPGSAGSISGPPQNFVILNGGTLVNAGTVSAFVQASGNAVITGTNAVDISNYLQEVGGSITIDTPSIVGIAGTTLSSGFYEAQGTGAVINLGGPLQNGTVDIQTIADPGINVYDALTLNGPTSEIYEWNGTGYVTVESTVTHVGENAFLDVYNGRDYNTTNVLNIDGASAAYEAGIFNLTAGTVTTAGLNINSDIVGGINNGGIVQGSATIVGPVVNNGTLMALRRGALDLTGTMDVTGNLTGTGLVEFDYNNDGGTLYTTGATMELNGVSAGQTIIMSGRDTLQLDNVANFFGTIQAMVNDQIVLTGQTVTSAVDTNGTLMVFDGSLSVASLVLAGNYAADHFTTTGSTIAVAAGAAVSPSITGAVAGQSITDAATVSPFSNIALTDPNIGQTETLTVALTATANGALSNVGGGSYNATTGVYTDIGAMASVMADLDGLVFTPTAHQVAPGQVVTTGFSISLVDSGMASATDNTTSVIATAGTIARASNTDILFQNDSGQLSQWQMNGLAVTTAGGIGVLPGPAWFAMGTGNFFGDGNTDILWQNLSGQVAIWDMSGGTILQGAFVDVNPGSAWHIKATGDFYGDGKADVLWQNDNGQVAIWEMNGGAIAQGNFVDVNPGPTWHIEGTGNFYGNGDTDILWQNDSGQVAIWDMHGGQISQGTFVDVNPGPAWRIQGTGDFYGDGNTDILWRNDDGQVAIWDMQGGTIVQGDFVAVNPGPAWHVEATGDFNNDGKTDIVWQNDNGLVAIWEMNGATIASGALITNSDKSWTALGSDHNMRFIYSASANETLTAAPTTPDEFVFTNAASGAHTIAGFNATQDIIELPGAQFAGFAAVQAAITATAGGAMINLGNSTSLLLSGVDATTLHASNFALA